MITGCDTIVALEPENLFYMTGFWGEAIGILEKNGKTTIIAPELEIGRAKEEGIDCKVIQSDRGMSSLVTLKRFLKGKVCTDCQNYSVMQSLKKLFPKIKNSIEPFNKSREIKDEDEITIMKKACQISAEAHVEAMKFVKPGMTEQEMEAFYQYEFSKRGGRFSAYTPIVAGGENACVLHYVENSKPLIDGELLLVDAGCEFELYASDITRTFPINGKFTAPQLAIYEVVLEAQVKSIEAISTNNNVMDAQIISEKVITQGLIDLGILQGSMEELHAAGAFKDFYMHKIGHWLGIDVHDAGDYMEDGDFMKFKPGMVTTVEPGIYISSSSNVDDKWKGIGIRIEDDILVTDDGNENLTAFVPSNPQEIEALMA